MQHGDLSSSHPASLTTRRVLKRNQNVGYARFRAIYLKQNRMFRTLLVRYSKTVLPELSSAKFYSHHFEFKV